MFRTSLKLFKIFGIEVRLDLSWFIIFALFAYYFGFYYFPEVLPGTRAIVIALITIITVLLFFISLLIHEMSHSIVARSKGTPVEKITLFLFGGMAQLEKEPDNPSSEFLMAIAGPVASFILAAIFGVIWFISRSWGPVAEPSRYLSIINIVLGVFNMLPGYPLDGGRVLRSIIWKATNNLKKATHIASTVGRVIGFLIIAAGIYFIFTGNFLNGVWLAFIGWFLQSTAQAGYRQLLFETTIKGIKVKDIMIEDPVNVSADTTLQELVDDYFMKYRFGRFPVVGAGGGRKFIGVISLHDVKAIGREDWGSVKVGDIVKTATEKEIVNPDTEVSDAIRRMSTNDLGHLAIMAGGRLKGIITKSDVLRLIKLRSELD